VRHRDLRLPSRFPRKKIWPWVLLAGVLLGVGLVELSIRATQRRAQTERAAAAPGGPVVQAPSTGGSPAAPATNVSAGISGTVSLPGGKPAAGIGVVAEPGGAEARTDAAGRFHLDVPDGTTVRIHAHHSDVGFGSVETAAPSGDVKITLQPRATFDVRAMRGGKPVEGAQVTVEETVARVYEADHLTDAEGRVRFRGLPPGRLRVHAVVTATGARGFTDADAHQGEAVEVTVQLHGP